MTQIEEINLDTLVMGVDKAFTALAKNCPHKDQTDCAHPDMDFNSMMCSPSNCPLIGLFPRN